MPMSFQLSPGVVTREYDLTTIIPQVATAGGAYVGAFSWGPVDKIKVVSSKERLIRYFGPPVDENQQYLHWFSCANFLEYSRNLKTVRVVDKDVARNATTSVAPFTPEVNEENTLILNEADWVDENSGGNNDAGEYAARYPGLLGNNLGIYVADVSTFNSVEEIHVITAGFGYDTNDIGESLVITAPTLAGGIQATAEIGTVANGEVTSIAITNPGRGYKFPPDITVPGPIDVQANVDFDVVDVGGGVYEITNVDVSDGGSGYTGVELVTFPSSGSDGEGEVIVTGGEVTGVTITTAGVFAIGDVAANIEAVVGPPTDLAVQSKASAELWKYRDQFLATPDTSNWVNDRSGSDDEMHIVVVDETGAIAGEKGDVLERFSFVSKSKDAKYDDGTSSYYVNVLRDASDYVFWIDHPPLMNNWGTISTGIDYDTLGTGDIADHFYEKIFSGAADGNNVSNNELMPGWDMFKNPENVDIGILISGPADRVLQQYLIQNIAEMRKDCVAVISPERSDVVRNPGDELDDTLTLRDVLTSSSYGIFDCNWKYQFDMYNDTFRWIPCNPDVAGIMAYTDENRDPWWSPAGYNRGHIKNCVKLAWNPDKTDRDELYMNGVNPICTFKNEGTLLFGDKTMLTKPSAFDRINVRRLFIVLEKAIAKASKYALFEFNDSFTRARFTQMVEPYLRDVQGRRGIYDFNIVCDESNNTGYVIDSNGFVGDIYIKPARSINFITLNFIATPTGVDFSEVQGMFGDF